eukprot:3513695-Prymnesium_polylepis.1
MLRWREGRSVIGLCRFRCLLRLRFCSIFRRSGRRCAILFVGVGRGGVQRYFGTTWARFVNDFVMTHVGQDGTGARSGNTMEVVTGNRARTLYHGTVLVLS